MNINEIERIVSVIDKLVNIQNKGRVTNSYEIERAIANLTKKVADAQIDEEPLQF